MLIFSIPLIYSHFNNTSNKIATSNALKEAKQIAETLKAVRYLYTSDVIDQLEDITQIRITHDYLSSKKDSITSAIPLPATFSMELAKKMSSADIKVNLYSQFPFPWRKERIISEFENRAWEYFIANPEEGESYYELDNENNQLEYAISDKMVHLSCVNCHNTHPQTPKNNWQLGDVRGVISISKPIHDNTIIKTANQKTYLILTGVFVLGILIIMFTIVSNRINTTKINEAHDKTRDLLIDSENLSQDLNDRKNELETKIRELKETQSQLVLSERMASLGQLTAGIAHELNNPINFINAGIVGLEQDLKDLMLLLEKYEAVETKENAKELLVEIKMIKQKIDYDYLKKEIPETIESIISGVGRSIEIVDGLRDFSYGNSKNYVYADINKCIKTTLTLLQYKLKDRIELVLDFDASNEEILCNPSELKQVFMNILMNAIQAIKDKGTITISTRKEVNNTKILIEDDGVGMDDNVKTHLFEPFFTTKEVLEGTGLGLSISYGIIQKHDGEIKVESELGKGSKFIITLPKLKP